MKKNELREKIQKEVDDNFDYFNDNLYSILKEYPNKKYALLKNKEVIECFDSLEDTESTANLLFKEDPIYSIQEINPIPLNLGYQSYALF